MDGRLVGRLAAPDGYFAGIHIQGRIPYRPLSWETKATRALFPLGPRAETARRLFIEATQLIEEASIAQHRELLRLAVLFASE